MKEDVIIVIPAYNPCEKCIMLLRNLYAAKFTKIVLVNDGSNDASEMIFDTIKDEFRDIVILEHAVNSGKGRALKTAFNYILNKFSGGVNVITVDADGQHKVEDIENVAAELLREKKNIVMGCRTFVNNETTKIPFRSKMGNVVTKYVLRYLCNINIMDTQTGLRGIPGELLKLLLTVEGERYEYEMNMLLTAVENGVELKEVPIETVYENNNATSHFNPLKDSLKIYMTIGKYSLASIISVIIDNSIFILGQGYTNNIWLLTFCGRCVAAIFNFLLNRQIVFGKKGDWKISAVKYFGLLICSGTMSALGVQVIGSFVQINIIVIRLFVETILFFVNFYFQKNVVFGKKK